MNCPIGVFCVHHAIEEHTQGIQRLVLDLSDIVSEVLRASVQGASTCASGCQYQCNDYSFHQFSYLHSFSHAFKGLRASNRLDDVPGGNGLVQYPQLLLMFLASSKAIVNCTTFLPESQDLHRRDLPNKRKKTAIRPFRYQ